ADDRSRGLGYLAFDHDCTTGSWSATVISKNEKLDSGYELALDGADRPHVAYTLDYNVALATGDGGTFTTKLAAASTALPADQIFLNYNCTVGGWLFHDPSIAITADGHTRLGFQARDASVAGSTTDHTHGSCVAGTDMTWSRFASL
ncbi:MAG TPA: hypothetical protein VGC41_02170, partial [Kofleriaceae bacterium]